MEKLVKSRRFINLIVVHCSATPAGRAVTAADIDAWHRRRGFDCIGYHYVIGLDGSIEAGRSPHRVGAHCLGHNSNSIGVCYAGGIDSAGNPADTRTAAQKRALTALLTALRQMYPEAFIRGHCDFAAKPCPCFDATAEYAHL